MTKKSRQKLKYLENEERFYDKIKSFFIFFLRAFIKTNKAKFFLGGEIPTLIKHKSRQKQTQNILTIYSHESVII